jgi:hypothetical protein
MVLSKAYNNNNKEKERQGNTIKPTIVCLCGSVRFFKTFTEASLSETLAGKIVLSIGAATSTDEDHFGHMSEEEIKWLKARLDVLHYQKIDMADEILVLNVGGYVGESTSREIFYALAHGKKIRFLENARYPEFGVATCVEKEGVEQL